MSTDAVNSLMVCLSCMRATTTGLCGCGAERPFRFVPSPVGSVPVLWTREDAERRRDELQYLVDENIGLQDHAQRELAALDAALEP